MLLYERNNDIYTADASGGNETAIVHGPTTDRDPWFSHDGTKIAFGRGPDNDISLMVANTDGTDVHQVMSAGQWADFTPSDTQLVATRTVDGHMLISIVDVDGTGLRDLDLGTVEPTGWVSLKSPVMPANR